MRGSKAKACRKASQLMTNKPYTDRVYDMGKSPEYTKLNGNWFKVAKGIPTTLRSDCGRSIYQYTKSRA